VGLLRVVRIDRVEFFGIFGAEHEHVSDLNATTTLEGLARNRTRFTSPHAAVITKLGNGEIAGHIHITQMKAVPIGAGHTVTYEANGLIGENTCQSALAFDRSAHRAQAAGLRAQKRNDFFRRRRADDAKTKTAEFRFFKFVATA